MELSKIKNVYLVGIGGIGMSGLARYFLKRGCQVSGYDRVSTVLTSNLTHEGAKISYIDTLDDINTTDGGKESTLIIYTPAIPKNSVILNYFRDNQYLLKKRSEVLGIISKGMFTIAVAGTHGKTTTSTLVAHILRHSGNDCTAFLGGISSNYNTNALFGKNNTMVVEADEYDRSFLTLHPDIAVVTSMDADHLDIYGTAEHLEESFRLFASQLKAGGRLIHKINLPLKEGISYSASELADVCAQNVKIENAQFYFDFVGLGIEIKNIEMPLPGVHNIENAVAAIQVALYLQIPAEKIKSAIADFKGVKRRFEYIVKNSKHIYIDDYAHHPEELKACITAVKRLYPEKKLTVIFQPHLYSRTRDFAVGFAESLSLADHLILLDIYPARELPIEGVTSEIILDRVKSGTKVLSTKENALFLISENPPELLLTVGAGDIDLMVEPIKEIMSHV
ncbi:UDP-N-acetylmuramate--alanine ligase [Arcticibacter svalbardensis MN12-7]|uniref:UDP-N-acetylmuramate--L-alanine ligase n=1 Tax=Arcticibacter svalbardensis MN12-7 TaxID=1150600 RepID=R9GR35_9SPHI|nr:UDP-N-acetylmuramate--L-alanine ligase [Arcticibacter svalbardensis]EOR94143.1 UDP-N-acetylmuramate--alanine ligase [Arcticibacter svalbardensis MN12-7]